MRYKVAIGVCKALEYLHDEIPRPVIHMDVKASNILLSHDFQPQVSSYIHSILQKTIGFFILGATLSSKTLIRRRKKDFECGVVLDVTLNPLYLVRVSFTLMSLCCYVVTNSKMMC